MYGKMYVKHSIDMQLSWIVEVGRDGRLVMSPAFFRLSKDDVNPLPSAKANQVQAAMWNMYPVHKLRGYKVTCRPKNIIIGRDLTGSQTTMRQNTTMHHVRSMNFIFCKEQWFRRGDVYGRNTRKRPIYVKDTTNHEIPRRRFVVNKNASFG